MKTGYTKEHKSLGTQVTLTELSVKGVWHETKNDNTKQNVKKCMSCVGFTTSVSFWDVISDIFQENIIVT